MKGIEHLKHPLRCIFSDVNSAAEHLAGGIEDDELHVGALARMSDAVNQFAEHVFVEQIVIGAIGSHAREPPASKMEFPRLKIGGIAAGWIGANLHVAISQGGAACFHGSFSLRNGSKADGSTQGWERLGVGVESCPKSLLAGETGKGACGVARPT